MKTHTVKAAEIQRDWFVVDARDAVLGRLASEIAAILRGKKKPTFSPHLDTGDHVIVVNAASVRLTGRKPTNKRYFRHTMYPGGAHWIPLPVMLEEKPTEVVRLAVKGMLPKNRLGRAMYRKLQVYAGAEHPHEAQQPTKLDLTSLDRH